MNSQPHANTPVLAVFDGRAGPVRRVDYLRDSSGDQTQRLITAQAHDVAGRIVFQWDPRLHGTETANLHSFYSLSGTPLLTHSVDGGMRRELFGVAGQKLRGWDGRGSEQHIDYDSRLRPVAIRERGRDQAWVAVEYLHYGDSSSDSARRNRCGRLVEHYDTAGRLSMIDYSMAGASLHQSRRFLVTLDSPDWPRNETERDALLEPTAYDTHWFYSALTEILGHRDAKGHAQRRDFDIAGQLAATHLQWADSPIAQVIVQRMQYNADGRLNAYVAGNGVMTTYSHDPANGRLLEQKAVKDSDVLQHFSYRYDPVGNMTSLTDHTHVTRYHANQRIEGVRRFTYDSLYRLESATGLEAGGAGTQPQLPALIPPMDLSLRTPYTQHYRYDPGGNLQTLIHNSAAPGQAHTLHLTMDPSSNRCVQWRKGDVPGDDLSFDADGNPLTLPGTGRQLTWNLRNQLHGVTQVHRLASDDDEERYVYDAQGLRVRKRQSSQAAATRHVREVRYLPGLEIRTLDDSQALHVCTLQGLGFNVRGLYWEKGRPEEIDQGQLRYSLEDHLGSLVKELDQDARLISHEGYYPFGGTAWWAADCEVQASQKTIRYSGKERDASGLYCYGLRYYAPWTMRWVNPDPAGPVDGLNLYAMVGNNPMRYSDNLGLNKDSKTLQGGNELLTLMSERTQLILQGGANPLPAITGSPAKVKKMREIHFSDNPEAELFLKKNRDDNLVAHAGFEIPGATPDETIRLTDFFNIPLPPQLTVERHGVVEYRPAEQGLERDDPVSGGIFKFGDIDRYETFLEKKLIETYQDTQRPIKVYKGTNPDPINLAGLEYETPTFQPLLQRRLKAHIVAGGSYLPKSAGLPGMHAESVGGHVALAFQKAMTGEADPSQILVVTQKLKGAKTASAFPACFNCANILMESQDGSAPFNVLTDRVNMTHQQWNRALQPYI
ncbi:MULTISPECIES: RHS repeat-associated core domain-containing protein [unclassified Pseudomonas]|uniref:RHS repeat-associated core domain-containing protein n=1 Tax=unclassified Pseudomonas TaxID=196821 RepID=UPI00090F6B19|nr:MULTISPECIES: RHS repeat-associated core domain-containing protein [unclassified Pseudomonas]SFY20747.1 insecticidal toxin complex protein TccC [Pseudomonas sp. NFACC47-1]SFY23006.1 insecticidal toxin complex protein TccC [Pseudomonas sp. NFACC43]